MDITVTRVEELARQIWIPEVVWDLATREYLQFGILAILALLAILHGWRSAAAMDRHRWLRYLGIPCTVVIALLALVFTIALWQHAAESLSHAACRFLVPYAFAVSIVMTIRYLLRGFFVGAKGVLEQSDE